MTPIPFSFVLVAALALAACTAPADAPAEPPPSSDAPTSAPGPGPRAGAPVGGPVLALEGEGLRVFDSETGASRALPFGTAMEPTLAALAALRGAPAEQAVNEECGAAFASWDGLTAWFDEGRFVGWAARSGGTGQPLTTASGVGVGSTRAELESAYDAEIAPSTLGEEFRAGALSGLLGSAEPDARVTDLWAGTACVFR